MQPLDDITLSVAENRTSSPPTPLREAPKLTWIDALKGIGMILVVYGHVAIIPPERDISSIVRYIYLFHMPMFFSISGFLFKDSPVASYVNRRVKSLLVPYAAFLILLTILIDGKHFIQHDWATKDYLMSVVRLFLGGTFLHLDVGVFWFLTTMFFVQVLYLLLVKRLGKAGSPAMLAVMLSLYALSAALAYFYPRIRAPLGISAIPFALICFWFGNIIREYGETRIALAISTAILAAWSALEIFGTQFSLDMKYSYYYPAFLVHPASLAMVHFIFFAGRRTLNSSIGRWFAPLGIASLVVMAMHNYFHFLLRDAGVSSDLVIILASIGASMAFYYGFKRFKATRMLFLGERS